MCVNGRLKDARAIWASCEGDMGLVRLVDDVVIGENLLSFLYSDDLGQIAVRSCTQGSFQRHRAWISETHGLWHAYLDYVSDLACRAQEERELKQFFRHRQLQELQWARGSSSDDEYSPSHLAERRGYDF